MMTLHRCWIGVSTFKTESNRGDRKMKPTRSLKFKENVVAYMFLLPSLLGFAFFIAFPIIGSLTLSFTSWNFLTGFKGIESVAFDNFFHLLSGKDAWFTKSLVNTILFAAI